MHWSRKRTKEFELNNLEIIKLNTGNEKTFWFNLIILLINEKIINFDDINFFLLLFSPNFFFFLTFPLYFLKFIFPNKS